MAVVKGASESRKDPSGGGHDASRKANTKKKRKEKGIPERK